MKHSDYDIVVIGGGHAGTEAAHVAWRMGAKVALVTFQKTDIGVLSCNPAIGGIGKGHLVREIDALDGLIGRVGDAAAIQYRLLNRSKGPAVHGPRAQIDRVLYKAAMQDEFDIAAGIDIFEDEVVDLIIEEDQSIRGVLLNSGLILHSKSTIITSGTFLRGLMHVGSKKVEGGRIDAPSSRMLADRIGHLNLRIGRLKTGTPPRLRRSSINYDQLECQPGDVEPTRLSFLKNRLSIRQIPCAITHTNAKTHKIVRDNIDQSAAYGDRLTGVGPRYCPSIEDKVLRFPTKEAHQIFLEPEGFDSDIVYPNGISTSLPAALQYSFVRSISGLENAEIIQFGYAIEYDFIDPRGLTSALSVPSTPGLFLAGQINGTTGYEEAAAQGIIAGMNAVRFVRNMPSVKFCRSTSYLGVLVDDLVTQGVTEPYRMFTSRAENRLFLRPDNADRRMTPVGIDTGCVGAIRSELYQKKMKSFEKAFTQLNSSSMSSSAYSMAGGGGTGRSTRISCYDALREPEFDYRAISDKSQAFAGLSHEAIEMARCDSIYSIYISRHSAAVEDISDNDNFLIPSNFSFEGVDGLSNEILEKLVQVGPETLGQASRIEGVTAAGISLLFAAVKRFKSECSIC